MNELSDILSKLDHYHPRDHDLADMENVLMGPPEFEVLRDHLFNIENPLSFDKTISQFLT